MQFKINGTYGIAIVFSVLGARCSVLYNNLMLTSNLQCLNCPGCPTRRVIISWDALHAGLLCCKLLYIPTITTGHDHTSLYNLALYNIYRPPRSKSRSAFCVFLLVSRRLSDSLNSVICTSKMAAIYRKYIGKHVYFISYYKLEHVLRLLTVRCLCRSVS